jgi:hypothetical protein
VKSVQCGKDFTLLFDGEALYSCGNNSSGEIPLVYSSLLIITTQVSLVDLPKTLLMLLFVPLLDLIAACKYTNDPTSA